jgi:circadian clock protein KaiC
MQWRSSTGITGLDEILYGGFLQERAYLIRGSPGAGKTILGLHFLLEGVKNNEPVLFITLSESEKSIRSNAERLNLPLNGLTILDLSPESEFLRK